MHTPSGCAYGCPCGAPIIGRDLFSFFVVARPLAFGSFPAPMGTFGCPYACPSGMHYNAPPKGWCICAPRRGAHLLRARAHPSGVCINGCPLGHPIMGTLWGPHNVQPIGCTLFFLSFVARPLAFGSFPAPMHTRWVCIWVPRWVHPLQYVQKGHPL